MAVRIVSALIAIVLFAAYLIPIAWKLGSPALYGVIGIGAAMMLLDLWQSVREEGEASGGHADRAPP